MQRAGLDCSAGSIALPHLSMSLHPRTLLVGAEMLVATVASSPLAWRAAARVVVVWMVLLVRLATWQTQAVGMVSARKVVWVATQMAEVGRATLRVVAAMGRVVEVMAEGTVATEAVEARTGTRSFGLPPFP